MRKAFILLLSLFLMVFIFGTDNITYAYQNEHYHHEYTHGDCDHEHEHHDDEHFNHSDCLEECGCCHDDIDCDLDTECENCDSDCTVECCQGNCEDTALERKDSKLSEGELNYLLNVEDKNTLSREQLIKLENYYHSLNEEELTELYMETQSSGPKKPVNRGNWNDLAIATYSDKKIENSYYFENFYMPSEYNNDGTCGYVAISSLLGWHDTFNSNNFVPDTLSYGNYSNINTMLKSEMTGNIKPKYQIGYSAKTTTGPTVNFHDYLYELGRDNGKDHWITQIGMADVMRYHINQQTNLGSSVTVDNTWLIFQTKKVEAYIDAGIPVAAMFLTYEFTYENADGTIDMVKTQTDMTAAHGVVIYGYKLTSEGIWYYAHSGWSGSGEGKMLIRNLSGNSNQNFAWIQYAGSHVCSANYKVKHGSCVVDVCAKCMPTQFTLDESTTNYDYYIHNNCSNTSRIAVLHKYNMVVSTTAAQHTKKCDDCDRTSVENHQALSGGNLVHALVRYKTSESTHTLVYKCCNRVASTNSHSFTYKHNTSKHWQECTSCKYTRNEAYHNYVVTSGNFDSHQLNCTTCSYEKVCTDTPSLITTTPSIHILSCHGYQVTRLHEFTGSDGTFEEHYAKCTIKGCNYTSPTLCNDIPTVTSKTSVRHTLFCHGKTKSEDHLFTAGSGTIYDHYPKCSNTECSYVKTIKCNEIVPIVSYNSSTHTYRCHGISLSETHVKYTSGSYQYCSVDGCNWSQATHTHSYGAPYIPNGAAGGMSRHYATCSCGSQTLRPCMGFAPDPGQNAICVLCGQEMIGGMVIMRLPNGTELVTYDEETFEFMGELLPMLENEIKIDSYNEKTYIILPKEQEYNFLE